MWLFHWFTIVFFQVREQAKLNAAKIRQSVKEEKQRQLQKLAKEIEVRLCPKSHMTLNWCIAFWLQILPQNC